MKRYLLTIFISLVITHTSHSQCFISSFGSLGSLSKTTGNTVLDQKFNFSKNDLESIFGVTADLYIYNDDTSPNAFATSHNSYDGLIAFGRNMLINKLWNRSQGEACVAGILAHEFAHVLQIKKGMRQSNSKIKELQADFLAGYYIGRKNFSLTSIQAFGNDLYSMGDYDFANSNHHGTPSERVSAMNEGYRYRSSDITTAYNSSLAFVYGSNRNNINTSYTSNTQRPQILVRCSHPAHPSGDAQNCAHLMHTQDIYPCSHACINMYGQQLACHPAGDAGPCAHRMHSYDIAQCNHLMHSQGDLVEQ